MRGWAVAFLLVCSSASAQSGGVDLSWVRSSDAASCPSATTLRQDVRSRLGYDPFTSPANVFLEGTVEHQNGVWTVRLFKRDATGALVGERELSSEAEECTGLAEAITLAVALAIDPEAALANNAETEPEAETHTDANAETETEAETGTETEAGTGTETETPTETRQAESRSPRLSIGATYAYNLVPNSGYGFRLRVDGAITALLRWVVDARFWPEQHIRHNGAKLGVGLTSASIGLCAGSSWGRFDVQGCAALDVGALHVVVYDPVPRDPGDRVYLGATLGVRPAIVLAGPVHLALYAGVSLPLIDHDLNVEGQPSPVFSPARAAPLLALEFGVTL